MKNRVDTIVHWQDLTSHDKYHIYLKLAIDGKQSEPFSAVTLPPFYKHEPQGHKDPMIWFSRAWYSDALETGGHQ